MTKVEHLSDDRYRVRIGAGRGLDGKYRQVSRTFHAKGQREADKMARQITAELDTRLRDAADRRKTVNGLVDEWQRVVDHASSTAYRNRSIIAAIRADLGHVTLGDLSARHLDVWYARLRESGRSASTINHYHRVLHSILDDGERWGWVPMNVARRSDPPARSKPRPRPPTTEALAALIADATPGLQLAALLAARLGLRRGEVCGLRWGDLDGSTLNVARSISDVPGEGWQVKLPKTEESVRKVTVDAVTLAVLEGLGAGQPVDGYILADPFDLSGMTPRSPGWLSQAWSRLCERHGVRIRFHDLRHWSATNMIGAGVPVTTVAARLGHAQTSTTLNVYSRALPGSDAVAAAALAELLPGPGGAPAEAGSTYNSER